MSADIDWVDDNDRLQDLRTGLGRQCSDDWCASLLRTPIPGRTAELRPTSACWWV